MKRFSCLIFGVALLLAAALSWGAERPKRVTAPTPPPAPAILSIIPAQGEPGNKVTIFGTGFGDRVSVFLGSVEIAARVTDGKQLEFVIPQLDAGLYALYLRRGDGVVGRVYNFTLQQQRPVLTALSPAAIGACAQGGEREVTAQGRNFSQNAQLLFDGAAIAARFVSSEAVIFSVPPVAGGLHQVMVRNGPENASVPLALTIETRPEIAQVAIGSEFVNYYELNIYGKNFNQNSSIYVDGQRVGGRGGAEVAEREKLIFVDCTRLIYLRYPYSPVNKDFRVQVVNPGGEGSQVVNVTAP